MSYLPQGNPKKFRDNQFTLQDDGDATKQLQFQASGITTATTRTLTAPDASDTIVCKATTDTFTNKTVDGTATGNAFTNMLTESAELASTPVTDTADFTMATTETYTAHYTMPSTHKFYLITGIEWKNGATVAGNIRNAVYKIDADPPSSASTTQVCAGGTTNQSGTNAVQRNSIVTSRPVRAGDVVSIMVTSSSASSTMRQSTGASSQNQQRTVALAINNTSGDNTSWTAQTVRTYLKIYYRGYS